MSAPFVHESSYVDEGAVVGPDTRIWHFCHIMSGARLGARCNVGQNVFVADGVVVGDGVKIQNNVSLYTGVEVGDHAFIGPSAVFTNVMNPRSAVERKDEYRPTRLGVGATIGANATIVCGVEIGAYAFVGAGAVVTRDVPPHALVYGTPATVRGWVCVCGVSLEVGGADEGVVAECASCGTRYGKREGRLSKLKPARNARAEVIW